MDSILISIKKMLGIEYDYTQFDIDIIMHINSVFTILNQLGVGPEEGFAIEDETAVWTDFMDNCPKLNSVKSYMYLKVKLLFDPPLSSGVTDSIKNLVNEFEWRLNVAAEPGNTTNS